MQPLINGKTNSEVWRFDSYRSQLKWQIVKFYSNKREKYLLSLSIDNIFVPELNPSSKLVQLYDGEEIEEISRVPNPDDATKTESKEPEN